MNNNQKRASIFVHYDKDNIVDDYVYYYLNELKTVSSMLIFVTVSDIPKHDIEKLEKLGCQVYKRENIGYDFYSYKVGIGYLDLTQYNELIICNDSVFGPLTPFKTILKEMENKSCDFWGITESYQNSKHIQSYFICFRKSVLDSFAFNNFWKSLKVIEDKNELIETYEIGLSQLLYSQSFESVSYIQYKTSPMKKALYLVKLLIPKPLFLLRLVILPFRKYFWVAVVEDINPSVDMWDEYLWKYKMPFVKKSIFFMPIHQKKILEKYPDLLESISEYPVYLIKDYIKRFGL